MISGHGTIATAVERTQRGAFDFLEKPLDSDHCYLVPMCSTLRRPPESWWFKRRRRTHTPWSGKDPPARGPTDRSAGPDYR